jgi:murein DD-endopeptidase MepM/ murein hydrolase activator NlpD
LLKINHVVLAWRINPGSGDGTVVGVRMSARPVHNRVAAECAEASADPDHHTSHERRTISNHLHPHHERRSAGERPRGDDGASPSRPAPRRPAGGAFTFGHGGRQVRLGPVAFWTVVGTLVIMAGWSVVTATYFAFQDDVLARMAARQAAMQFAYEDRLAEMRAQVDRATSRQLLDQEQLEQKLDQIVRRQAVLESRATTLGSMADSAVTGTVRPAGRATPPAPAGTLKPLPMSGPSLFAPATTREAKFDPSGLANSGRAARPRGSMRTVLARLTESLDRVEGRQTNALAALEETYDAKARRLRAVLADAGIDSDKAADQAVGGPFVPYRLPANAGAFERQVYRINVARAQAERLNATLVAVPLRKPVDGEIDTTSNFGVRIDPFIGRPAMHTGLDFRGDTGEAIHVTAGGTVVSAGWSGGYGRMVEVDHGNGLSTRYGHLSEIDVKVGERVKAGQPVGRLGSTGRSTGPHLHYETRIDGEAVDPTRFLHAGAKVGLM